MTKLWARLYLRRRGWCVKHRLPTERKTGMTRFICWIRGHAWHYGKRGRRCMRCDKLQMRKEQL